MKYMVGERVVALRVSWNPDLEGKKGTVCHLDDSIRVSEGRIPVMMDKADRLAAKIRKGTPIPVKVIFFAPHELKPDV